MYLRKPRRLDVHGRNVVRNLAYSGWSKVCATGKQHKETAFIWQLNAGSEEGMESLIKRMCELTSPETGPVESETAWYLKVILEYFWFYPNLNVTGGAVSSIVESAAKLLSTEKDASVTPMDVVVHACLTGNVNELLTTLSADGKEFGGSMTVCHIVDLLYYTGSLSEALPAERDVEQYRDGRLSDYIDLLTFRALPKALGYRLAEDYAAASHEENLRRRKLSKILLETAEEISPTDNDLMAVIKRSLDHRLPDVALRICFARYEALSDTDVLSAIRWLERSQDISTSRKPLISDYLDALSMKEGGVGHLVDILKAANRLNAGEALGRGRLGFYSRLAAATERPEGETIAKLIVSDDCPPEALPVLLSELRRAKSCGVQGEEAMGVLDRLQDCDLNDDEADLVESLLVESFLNSSTAGSPQPSSVLAEQQQQQQNAGQWVFVQCAGGGAVDFALRAWQWSIRRFRCLPPLRASRGAEATVRAIPPLLRYTTPFRASDPSHCHITDIQALVGAVHTDYYGNSRERMVSRAPELMHFMAAMRPGELGLVSHHFAKMGYREKGFWAEVSRAVMEYGMVDPVAWDVACIVNAFATIDYYDEKGSSILQGADFFMTGGPFLSRRPCILFLADQLRTVVGTIDHITISVLLHGLGRLNEPRKVGEHRGRSSHRIPKEALDSFLDTCGDWIMANRGNLKVCAMGQSMQGFAKLKYYRDDLFT
ncbi:hypothetical protein FOZ63_026867, partial [Perkinsus olseni]